MWAMVTKAVQAVSPDTASTAYFTASDHCLLVLTTVSSWLLIGTALRCLLVSTLLALLQVPFWDSGVFYGP